MCVAEKTPNDIFRVVADEQHKLLVLFRLSVLIIEINQVMLQSANVGFSWIWID